MVPFDFAQRVLQSDGTTADSPYFAKNPTPTQSWAMAVLARPYPELSPTAP